LNRVKVHAAKEACSGCSVHNLIIVIQLRGTTGQISQLTELCPPVEAHVDANSIIQELCRKTGPAKRPFCCGAMWQESYVLH